jgi:3-hydroxybutyryl-CoA dehydrogenase
MGDTVAVIGAGLMGSGIAQVAAVGGFDIRLQDVNEQAAARGLAGIEKSLSKLVDKSALDADTAASALKRIHLVTTLPEAVAEADVVVEAVIEDVALKQEIFAAVEAAAPASSILATNTSAIPITRIAAATKQPERVVGTHFFSPVPLMPLVELVRGRHTADETLARARRFAEQVGKECVVVNHDVAGFITTRLISALANEAVRLVDSGVATAADVDTACRLGFGHAMGPLATIDLTGVDVMVNAARAVYDETRDPKFFPPELLQRMVAAGDLGRKSGRGFFEYPA